MKDIVAYFRRNPQVFILFLICLILGVGTFFIVLFSVASSGSTNNNGEPSGAIGAAGALIALVSL
jgi:hypothetical protein